MKKRDEGLIRSQKGVSAVMAMVAMFVFITLLAIVIDLGHLHAVRQELQNAADASALAGARAMLPLALNDPNLSTVGLPYCSLVSPRAKEAAQANYSDGEKVVFIEADAKVIHWDWNLNKMSAATPSCTLDPVTGANGVTVTVRSSSATPGGVFLTFSRLFGPEATEVIAEATAAWGFVAGLPWGPFNNLAINKDYLDSIEETGTGMLAPDPGDNAAWAAGPPEKPNAGNLKDWLNGSQAAPGMVDDGMINIDNGTDASVLKAMQDALTKNYNAELGGWLVFIPVVGATKMVKTTQVLDFQPIIITSIDATGNPKGIQFKLYPADKPIVVPGSTPGNVPSTLFTLPKLVDNQTR